MKRSKDKFYMKQIFDCISDGEIIATGKIAKEIGLSEKSVRNRLNELSDFLLENKLGEIQRKPRVGIWLEANENQKEEIQKILSDENLQVGNYDPRDRVNEILKVFFNLRPWQTMTTQKLAEKLFLSVPTMLKVLKECEEWLEVYHISLVNERGKGYRLKSEENEYRVALKNLIMMKKPGEEIKENIDYFFSNIDVSAIRKCIIQTENEWDYHFTDESFYEILIYCCIAYKRKELALPLVSDYFPEELKILKKYNEYAFTVAIFEKLEEVFHVHFLIEDVLFLSKSSLSTNSGAPSTCTSSSYVTPLNLVADVNGVTDSAFFPVPSLKYSFNASIVMLSLLIAFAKSPSIFGSSGISSFL